MDASVFMPLKGTSDSQNVGRESLEDPLEECGGRDFEAACRI